jgi:hypothetical protein
MQPIIPFVSGASIRNKLPRLQKRRVINQLFTRTDYCAALTIQERKFAMVQLAWFVWHSRELLIRYSTTPCVARRRRNLKQKLFFSVNPLLVTPGASV